MSQSEDQHNQSGLILFTFAMIFSFAFFGYISFIHKGVDLKELPEMSEGGVPVASAEKKAVDISGVTNPWVSSEDMVARGAEVYKTNCAVCHGNTGLGDGPAGKSIGARNLVDGQWKKGGDAKSLFLTITNGLEGTSMAAFGHIPLKDRWAMVHYIQSITKNKQTIDAASLEAFAKTAE